MRQERQRTSGPQHGRARNRNAQFFLRRRSAKGLATPRKAAQQHALHRQLSASNSDCRRSHQLRSCRRSECFWRWKASCAEASQRRPHCRPGRGIGVESLPQRQAKKGGIARHRRGRRSRTHPCCRHRRRALRGRGPAHSSVPAGQLYPLRVSWQTAASLDASLSSCPSPLLARSCGKTKIQAASERLIERSKFRTFRRIFSSFVSTSKQTGCSGRGRLARKVSRRAETRTKVK